MKLLKKKMGDGSRFLNPAYSLRRWACEEKGCRKEAIYYFQVPGQGQLKFYRLLCRQHCIASKKSMTRFVRRNFPGERIVVRKRSSGQVNGGGQKGLKRARGDENTFFHYGTFQKQWPCRELECRRAAQVELRTHQLPALPGQLLVCDDHVQWGKRTFMRAGAAAGDITVERRRSARDVAKDVDDDMMLMAVGVKASRPDLCMRPHVYALMHHRRCLLQEICTKHKGCGHRWSVNLLRNSFPRGASAAAKQRWWRTSGWWKCPKGCHKRLSNILSPDGFLHHPRDPRS